MKKTVLALTLAAALALSAGSVALAQEGPSGLLIAPNPTAQQKQEEQSTPVHPPVSPETEPGVVRFEGLDDKLRQGGYAMLALQEGIAQLEAMDYEELGDQLRQQLNDTVALHWETITMTDTVLEGLNRIPFLHLTAEDQVVLQTALAVSTKSTAATLEDACDSLRESIEDLEEGRMRQDNEDLIWKLKTTRDQTVMVGESSYIMLVGLQRSRDALERSLAALDRAVQELELRYEKGQISALTLQETRAGRAALESGMQTMDMSLNNLRISLEMLLGLELTGTLHAAALPEVTAQQLADMDLAADLERAKQASSALREAAVKLEDAQETWEQAREDAEDSDYDYPLHMAEHAWNAARYTYQATVQQFETGFRVLYLQVKDYAQILGAKQTQLAVEQAAFAAAQLKYEQGSISQNALLTAQDELAAAQDEADAARDDLFSGYRSYWWAVEHGILN